MMMCGLKLLKAAGQRLHPALTTAHALNAACRVRIALALGQSAVAPVPNANPLAAMARASQKPLIRHGHRVSLIDQNPVQRRRCATLASVISSDAAKIVPADPAALIARSAARRRSAAVARRAGTQRLS